MRELYSLKASEASVDKLIQFLQVSESKKCQYAWIDTICINKEISSELDESIRSMYGWYRDSHICIVHLAQTDYHYDMRRDVWFTRGWTLQELIAPKRISFFTKHWMQITHQDRDKAEDKKKFKRGGKDEASVLWKTISDITGIPTDDLLDFKPGLYDIGKRMKWVSKRTTTRVEDIAYCLIGVFRLSLSISYGEKEGAFYRLQAEIAENSKDRSLFNWHGRASPYNSMFAASPACFADIGQNSAETEKVPLSQDPTLIPANYDLSMSLILFQMSEFEDIPEDFQAPGATAFAILGPSPQPEKYFIVVLGQIEGNHQYKRLKVVVSDVDERSLAQAPVDITIR
jgi:hypothetical protein